MWKEQDSFWLSRSAPGKQPRKNDILLAKTAPTKQQLGQKPHDRSAAGQSANSL
jgi:hypothetical protein